LDENQKIKILHLCTTDTGGAGGAVVRINKLFNERGYDSAILVFKKSTDDNQIIDIGMDNPRIIGLKVIRKIFHEFQRTVNRNIINKYNFFNYSEKHNYLPSELVFSKLPFRPDVVIVHYASHYLNTRNVFELKKHTGAEVIFTMMDMSPITGGCHYAWDCRGYEKNCGSCPAISSNNPSDITYKSLLYKKQYTEKIKPTMVVATEWSLRQATSSSLFRKFPIKKILLPIDENIYQPGNKIHARNLFHISPKRHVIFVGAQSLADERKGFIYLFEALKYLYKELNDEQRKEILIITAGDKDISKHIPFKVKHLGIIRGNEQLVKTYHAADIFVCPSVEDSGPMMINEAIMCGTPVVSFEMGVSLDLVNEHTGYRAKNMDSKDLAKGIKLVLFHPELKAYSERCRKLALELFSFDIIFSQWESVINELVKKNLYVSE
jgi:glycosyltransferase involved in cell wall biosynthesis